MVLSFNITYLRAGLAATLVAAGFAFQSRPEVARVRSALKVSVDPSLVTRKEYQDIIGADFDNRSFEDRLKTTNFLYPKHVEVVEDIAPVAGRMVDEVVSRSRFESIWLSRLELDS
jgi:hypothetical protein